MQSEERDRKKKSKKAKKLKRPKKNQNINSYLPAEQLDSDEEQALDKYEPNPDVPYPELLDAPELKINGNSLSNVPRVHAKPKGFGNATGRVFNTFVARSREGCVYKRCIGLLALIIFIMIVFVAGVTYEDHALQQKDPPIVHDGNSEQTNGNGGPNYADFINGADGHVYNQNQKNIIVKLKQLSGAIISTPNTAHHKAAHWMLWVDQSGLTADSPSLLQRYTLALLYFKMGENNISFTLNEDEGECDWEKVGCDGMEYVDHLSLANCDMHGVIPYIEIQSMQELKFLDLSGNHLSGEIPEEFVTLTNLETLLLDDNDLVGTLPPLVCSLRDKGTLKTLTSDCNTNKVACSCCTNCVIQMPDVTPDDGHFNLTPRQTLILDKLMQLSGESAVTTEGTVQHKAARWLMKVDEMDLDANSPNLFQRYTLAVLYYMMPDDNKCFLMKKDENECDWKGNYVEGIAWDRISCDANNHLNYLKLEKCNLGGLIPSEIESFSKLDYLDLSQNKLTGQVPSGYQNLHQLVHMYLDDNKMDGQVPSGVCQLRETAALQSFVTDCLKDDLRVHCDCCTNCPSPAGNEQVPGNHLVGLDSRELAIMNKLKEISGNAVADEGTPQHRAAHFLMKQDGMKLTASSTNLYQRYVVTLLGEMSDLDNKCFERQSGISECQWISKGVGGVTWDRIACDSDGVVEYLKLDHCGISGNIPSELKVLTALNYLDLSKNSFDGIVPFELSTLHNLGHLYLDGNSLVGEVPAAVCDLRNNEKLMKFDTDCTDESKKVICDCCTNCIDTEGSTTDSRQIALLEQLKILSGDAVLKPNSVQQKAANWVMNEDTERRMASSKHLYQRYVLAIMYYMMGDEKWFSLDGEKDECQWERIGCDVSGRVNHIKFDHCDMHGPIPKEISVLTELEFLDLSNNSISGNIITELSDMTMLKKLFLEHNDIVGTVPLGLCERKSQGFINAFTTDCVGDTVEVQCSCCDNCVAGVTPSLDTMTDEEKRKRQIREKVGTLSYGAELTPASAQSLAMKWIIEGDKQHVTISSPHFTQRYVIAVIYFYLGGESWINSFWLSPTQDECDIPGVKCNAVNRIIELDFSNQGMSGQLPPEIAHLFELTKIDFSDNDIEGNVPDQWMSLTKLSALDLRNTKMTGEISSKVCALRSQKLLSFEVECDDITCSCCTNCDGGSRVTKIRDKVMSISFKPDTEMPVQEKKARAAAMEWITHVDQFPLDVSTDRFTDRYILTIFYYFLNGDSWVDDGKSVPWLHANSMNHCDWKGISCNSNNNVVAIHLASLNLSGKIPYEIGKMQYLRYLDLHSNEISGPLPNELGDVGLLNMLDLHSNNLQSVGVSAAGVCSLRYAGELTILWVDCDMQCPKGCCTKCGSNGTPMT